MLAMQMYNCVVCEIEQGFWTKYMWNLLLNNVSLCAR